MIGAFIAFAGFCVALCGFLIGASDPVIVFLMIIGVALETFGLDYFVKRG